MISSIFGFLSTLSLVGVTVWVNFRTMKWGRTLIDMTREAEYKCIEATMKYEESYNKQCEYAYRLEAMQNCVDGYRIWEGPRGFSVMAIHSAEGTIRELLSETKSYPFDPADPESKDFARRNAEELVEILKRDSI